jgi:hypothetical protein
MSQNNEKEGKLTLFSHSFIPFPSLLIMQIQVVTWIPSLPEEFFCNISSSAGLQEYICSFLFEKAFISPSCFRDSFARNRTLALFF